jgi:hypothetical protein
MTRGAQGFCLILASIIATIVVLAAALAWGPHHCKPAFPMVVGCAIGNYETLAGGMIAASAALVAGWLAWSGVQAQIEAEEKRATAGRIEVEAVLKDDINNFAEALASIWKILETHEEGKTFGRNKVEAINYGIETIAKENWLSTSRRMVTVLGWDRRRKFEQLFDGLEGMREFRNLPEPGVGEALNAVKSVSVDFEIVQPETAEYFKGLFRRAGKAWSLGYAIARMGDLPEERDLPTQSDIEPKNDTARRAEIEAENQSRTAYLRKKYSG